MIDFWIIYCFFHSLLENFNDLKRVIHTFCWIIEIVLNVFFTEIRAFFVFKLMELNN